MSDDDFAKTSPEFTALDPREHACDTCDNKGNEPIVSINGDSTGSRSFVCARCLKGAIGLLRGLGLTS